MTLGLFLIALRGAKRDHSWGSWGNLGCPFWGLGVALGAHSGGLEVPLDPFAEQSSQKTTLLFHARLVLNDFGAQSESQRVPTWS